MRTTNRNHEKFTRIYTQTSQSYNYVHNGHMRYYIYNLSRLICVRSITEIHKYKENAAFNYGCN